MTTTAQTDKMTTKNYIVVVPVEGSPYIHSKEPKDQDKRLKLMQEIVGGYIEPSPHGYYTVHPLFAKENKKWDIVRQLLNCKQVKVYGNEDGMHKCSPNVGLVIKPEHRFPGWAPHSWGNEVLVVPEKVLALLKVSVDDLKEQCCECEKELGEGFKEYDVLMRVCKECAEESDAADE